MAAHPNETIARGIYDAYLAGNMDAASEAVADDVVWHYIGSSEPLRGKAAVAAHGPASFDADITADVHDVLANDDHVVAMLKVHAARNGKTLDYDVVEVMHISDGKITERWAVAEDTAAIAAFFA